MDATVAGKLRVQIRGGTLEHEASGARLTLDGDTSRVVVGRGESCHLRLKDDRQVSAAHCEFMATERGVCVRDLTSKNGTWVNEVLLGPNQHAFLRKPATLRLGDATLTFTPKKEAGEREIGGRFGLLDSRSVKMGEVFDRLEKIARLTAAIHITGETGTGKNYLARAIHNQSARATKPFTLIDCSSIPPTLAEAELFGYSKGAFTGATKAKASPFLEASGGTVFLNEVGDLPLDIQAKLLHVVDEQEIKPIGQNQYQKVDVRIISATVHDLAARVNAGLFREDLHARLTATRVELPPLRERKEDIEPLVKRILSELGHEDLFESISPETLAWLVNRPWTGNVRQLRRVVMNGVELARHGVIDIEMGYSLGPAESAHVAAKADSNPAFVAITAQGTSHEAVVEQASRILLGALHRESNGNVSEIARRAGISRDYARELLQKYGLRDVAAPPRRKKDDSRDSEDDNE